MRLCEIKIIYIKDITFNSNPEIAIPEAAPNPAKPMKCPLPTLLANKDAPTFLIIKLWLFVSFKLLIIDKKNTQVMS